MGKIIIYNADTEPEREQDGPRYHVPRDIIEGPSNLPQYTARRDDLVIDLDRLFPLAVVAVAGVLAYRLFDTALLALMQTVEGLAKLAVIGALIFFGAKWFYSGKGAS